MSKDNIIKLIQPGNVDDQLTEILRNGARALAVATVPRCIDGLLIDEIDHATHLNELLPIPTVTSEA